MPLLDEPFLRFVRAVQRRMRIVRALEGMGIGALVGSILGLLLIGALLWRSAQSLLPGAVMVGLGAGIGLIWGALRPTPLLSAAVEADRQLNLRDLLASALSARHSNDPWARSVVAMAVQRCVSLHPRQVMLNRLGVRAWGSIATAAALTLAVAMLAPRADLTLASDTSRAFVAARDLDQFPIYPALPLVRPQQPAPPVEPDRPTAIPMATDDHAQAGTREASIESLHRTEIADPHGSGGGEGRTEGSLDFQRLAVSPTRESADPQPGSVSAGARRESFRPGDGPSAGAHVASESDAVIPPWQSEDWPARREAAMEILRQNEIPAAYRDLVRAFYSRQAENGTTR